MNKLNLHVLDDLVNYLKCGPNFDLSDDEGLTTEERVLCQRLKTVCFDGIDESPSPSAIEWLTACFEHCMVLETVRLWDVRSLTMDVFQTAAFRSACLTKLHLRWCNVTNTMVQYIAASCKQLLSLSVDGGMDTEHPGSVQREDLLSDSGLMAIAKGCQLLEEVYLGHQTTNTGVLEAFVMHCPHLHMLHASECALSAAALNALATRCRSLTSLSITWAEACSECAIEVLIKLESLFLKVDLTGGNDLAKALQTVALLCNALRLLQLVVTNGRRLCPDQHHRVSAALAALAKANPNVAQFFLHGLHSGVLQDAHVAAVAQCWPKLYVLMVTSGLTDAALPAFAQHCPELNELRITGADPPITDCSVLALAQHCVKLSSVSLPWAFQVTEEAFTELVRCCPQLDYLVVPISIPQEAMKRIAAAKLVGRLYVSHSTGDPRIK